MNRFYITRLRRSFIKIWIIRYCLGFILTDTSCEIRASDLSDYRLRHSQISLTWPRGPDFKSRNKYCGHAAIHNFVQRNYLCFTIACFSTINKFAMRIYGARRCRAYFMLMQIRSKGFTHCHKYIPKQTLW